MAESGRRRGKRQSGDGRTDVALDTCSWSTSPPLFPSASSASSAISSSLSLSLYPLSKPCRSRVPQQCRGREKRPGRSTLPTQSERNGAGDRFRRCSSAPFLAPSPCASLGRRHGPHPRPSPPPPPPLLPSPPRTARAAADSPEAAGVDFLALAFSFFFSARFLAASLGMATVCVCVCVCVCGSHKRGGSGPCACVGTM